jgi:hypothetical protein
MNNSRKRYISGLLLLVLYSCQPDRPVQHQESVQAELSNPATKEFTAAPSDFSFVIKDDVNTLNSRDSTYRRKYLSKESVVTLWFTQQEVDSIYASYKQNGIDTMPEDYNAGCITTTFPTFYEELTLTCNGQVRKLTYNSDYECSNTVTSGQLGRINTFLRLIDGIVKAKEAVKNMKETDIVFMLGLTQKLRKAWLTPCADSHRGAVG